MPRRPLQALAFLLGLWLALAGMGPLGFAAGPPSPAPASALEAERARLAAAADAARAVHGASPFARRAGLDAAARWWSRHLAVTLGPRPGVPLPRPPSTEGPARWNAAVLAPGEGAEEAVTRWLADPASRARLLDPETRAAGIGVACQVDGGLLLVQVYAEPAGPSAR